MSDFRLRSAFYGERPHTFARDFTYANYCIGRPAGWEVRPAKQELPERRMRRRREKRRRERARAPARSRTDAAGRPRGRARRRVEIGRATCRERVDQYG